MAGSSFNERLLNYAEEVLRSAGRPLTSKSIIEGIVELVRARAESYNRRRSTSGKRYEVAPQKLTRLMGGDNRFVKVGYVGGKKRAVLWSLAEWKQERERILCSG